MVETTLYQHLKDAGCELDNHYSDLYVKATKQAEEAIMSWQSRNFYKPMMERFRSNVDGEIWINIPLHFDPYWEQRSWRARP